MIENIEEDTIQPADDNDKIMRLSTEGEKAEARGFQKPKKKLTDKQIEIGKANLAKGRQALAEKKRKEKEEAQKIADVLIVKKAEKLVKQKERKVKQIKDIIGDERLSTEGETEQVEEPTQQLEIEERIIKKPKKKRIVYREESDSEEEVIVKSRPKTTKKTIIEEPNPKQMFKINFC